MPQTEIRPADPLAARQQTIDRLRQIRSAQKDIDRARARLARAVTVAHDSGATWGDIGGVLGISRQGARKRFGQ